ncbi:MAG: hypothetical protein DRO87_11980 [Candidatus Thorarchaeota archaeon]|nr:MAG: hypothetical protein DRO87_11980 [Candidatus Thorarchaeota archaeon]
MITPTQIMFAVLVSFVAAVCTTLLKMKIRRKKDAVFRAFAQDVFANAVIRMKGVKLKNAMALLEDLLRKNRLLVNARIHECPDYGIIIYVLRPRHNKKEKPIKLCLIYNTEDGEYRIVGNIVITHMSEEDCEKLVKRSYHNTIKTGGYDEISEIVKGAHGTGFVIDVQDTRISVGAIKRGKMSGSVSMSLLKGFNLNNEAIAFVFGGHILDL